MLRSTPKRFKEPFIELTSHHRGFEEKVGFLDGVLRRWGPIVVRRVAIVLYDTVRGKVTFNVVNVQGGVVIKPIEVHKK